MSEFKTKRNNVKVGLDKKHAANITLHEVFHRLSVNVFCCFCYSKKDDQVGLNAADVHSMIFQVALLFLQAFILCVIN